MSKISFESTATPFFRSLKSKVNEYFTSTGKSRNGGAMLFFKGLGFIVSAIAIYVLLVFFPPQWIPAVLLCAAFGANLAAIGFNVMHEGGHGSFSKHKWINSLSAYTLNIMGGTIHFWKQKHNIDHHTYTNIDGRDHDIDIKFMRMHDEQGRKGYHRFQQYYWVLLYGISYIAWVLYQDFEKYFSGKMGKGGKSLNLSLREHGIFWGTKLGYLFIYLVLPIIMVGTIKALIGFLIAGLVCGFTLSMVFQLAHVVEGTSFPNAQSGKIKIEWAVHQISSTANFSTKNKLACFFLGGLNFQVEHHLFPTMSHVHYPKISELVRQTCMEFEISYLEHKNILTAFTSHLAHLKKLGQSG
ncbi:fatty acid desaturase family protein [Pedobacter kyonggii]|uniref:Acyl-CoA desaturase n=1 Tax=Pedobacter kyonggii TaxID=1926871 RepID=A0A4Q9H3B3_9SPHI|nr:acyl-CoA desaturase [Pedobacter kyonggii]TBO35928.1 acyl-CoA desaturase [Pedobacter kyonggii]